MYCGIDLGSRYVKVALMQEGRVADTRTYETIPFYRQYGRMEGGQLVVDFSQLGIDNLEGVVTTGYGRNVIDLKGAVTIPELKAHTLGAVFQTGLEDFTLLDLGGQDSKVVKVRRGKMVDFQTNDKCAASSGKYLENMAVVLGISLAELSRHKDNPVELSSTCAVFGESELIGKVLEGHSLGELAAGVNYTIFKRVQPMLRALESPVLVFTGGVAHNQALVGILERELGIKVVVPEYPQFNGAIGCALQAGALNKKE